MRPTMHPKWFFPAGAFPGFWALLVVLHVKYFAMGFPVGLEVFGKFMCCHWFSRAA